MLQLLLFLGAPLLVWGFLSVPISGGEKPIKYPAFRRAVKDYCPDADEATVQQGYALLDPGMTGIVDRGDCYDKLLNNDPSNNPLDVACGKPGVLEPLIFWQEIAVADYFCKLAAAYSDNPESQCVGICKLGPNSGSWGNYGVRRIFGLPGSDTLENCNERSRRMGCGDCKSGLDSQLESYLKEHDLLDDTFVTLCPDDNDCADVGTCVPGDKGDNCNFGDERDDEYCNKQENYCQDGMCWSGEKDDKCHNNKDCKCHKCKCKGHKCKN